MENLKKYLVMSPAVLGGVVLCFFMNFFTIQCSNQKLASISGYDLVVGGNVNMNKPMGGEQDSQDAKKLSPNLWALAALVLAVAGILVYFINPPKKLLITAALAFAAFISLLILKSSMLGQLMKHQEEGGRQVDMEKIAAAILVVPETGYYLALIGLAAVGLFNVLLLKEVSKGQTPAATGEQV